MHGRVKVKTTAEQQAAKEKERAHKLKLYTSGQQKAFLKRDKGEFDTEALELTGQLLLANPDLYTLWNFRKEILSYFKKKDEFDVHSTMEAELPFTENCLRKNPKSYGVWYHRTWVLREMCNPDWIRELQLCNKYLELDERNFLCWDHRRFIAKNAAVGPEDELQFTDAKIAANFSNYSSWHYRSKLLPLVFPDNENNHRPICEQKLLQEFELVQNAAFTEPNDQSAWFYHRWLLGRGVGGVKLNMLHVKRNGEVTLVLNKPVQLDSVAECIQLAVCQTLVNADWSLPHGCLVASHVLLASIGNDGLLNYEEVADVCATYKMSDQLSQLNVKLEKHQLEGSAINPESTKDFCMELSVATSSVLAKEIQSCIQLQEMEPDCKWPLLTTVLLMRSLDYAKYKDQIMEYLAILTKVDSLRAGYYKNLKSKIIMENCLESWDSSLNWNLSNKGLDCLFHLQYLVHLRKLDLSSNQLTQLSGTMFYLVNLEVLLLDDNQLSACDEFRHLAKLQELSICNNNYSDISSMEGLTQCKYLISLAVKGNPIDEATDQFWNLIRSLLPNLEMLDGVRLQRSQDLT